MPFLQALPTIYLLPKTVQAVHLCSRLSHSLSQKQEHAPPLFVEVRPVNCRTEEHKVALRFLVVGFVEGRNFFAVFHAL